MARLTLFYKNRSILSHPIESKYTTVGRDKNCDIVIDSMAVNSKHAVVIQSGLQYRIKPATPDAQLIINHQKVEDHLLDHGDVIQLGQYTLSYSENSITLDFTQTTRQAIERNSPPTEPGNEPDKLDQLVGSLNVLPKSCLQITSGEHVGKTIPLHRSLLRLGLSGNQCAIIAHRSDGYYLSHLEGDHPPLVNGEAIDDKSVRLNDGNIIQIGEIQMRFHEEIAQAAAI